MEARGILLTFDVFSFSNIDSHELFFSGKQILKMLSWRNVFGKLKMQTVLLYSSLKIVAMLGLSFVIEISTFSSRLESM